MIVLIQLFQARGVNHILQLGDSKVLNLNWVGHGPLLANRYGRDVINMLDQLQLGSSVQGLTFKSDSKRLAIGNLEYGVQVMTLDLFGEVHDTHIHLLTWGQ